MQANRTILGKDFVANADGSGILAMGYDAVDQFHAVMQASDIHPVIKMGIKAFHAHVQEAEFGRARNLRASVHFDPQRTLFDGIVADLVAFDFVFTDAPNGVPMDPKTTPYPFTLYQFYLRLDENDHPVQFIKSVRTH